MAALDRLQSLSKSARAAATLVCVVGAIGVGACGSPGPDGEALDPTQPAPAATPDTAPEEPQAGSLSLDLDVGGVHLDSASYTIVGPSYKKTGSLDVSHSSKISGIIAGIPFGNGYSVTLSAESSAPVVASCDGSSSFQITGTSPVSVTVPITCRTQKAVAVAAAPIPPAATAAIWLLLLGIGLVAQRRVARAADSRAS